MCDEKKAEKKKKKNSNGKFVLDILLRHVVRITFTISNSNLRNFCIKSFTRTSFCFPLEIFR